jgi:predicted metal-dependent hydrolase
MSLFRSPLADGARLDLEGVALRLKVNPRSRRISLRIDTRSGEAVATAPSARSLADAVAFARSRRWWLVERLAVRPAPPSLTDTAQLRLFGSEFRLRPDGRRPRVEAGVIVGCGQGEVDVQLVIRAIRRMAQEVFEGRAAVHCARLGVSAPKVLVSDTRSRWGSCSAAAPGRAATIRLSWRLALASFEVADYVVAHECAHLVEANHGPRFWATVRALVGDPARARAALRHDGARLQAFGRSSPACGVGAGLLQRDVAAIRGMDGRRAGR